MSIFGNIMDKIFRHPKAQAQAQAPSPPPPGGPAPQSSAPAQGGDTATMNPAPAQAAQNVDVGAVLSEMASMKDGGGNYQSSIVDLLKLLDLDSSLTARKELGEELGVYAGEDEWRRRARQHAELTRRRRTAARLHQQANYAKCATLLRESFAT
jgi:hypothetical protein